MMMRNGALSAGLVVALGWVFQGCSGKSTSTSDAVGGSGGTSVGGTGAVSGKGAKGGGAGRSGSGGGTVGGASGVAGVAGVAGVGGGDGGTGGTVAGMGGIAGVVGSAGDGGGVGFDFDDVCECTSVSPGVDDEVEFECTILLEALAVRMPVPSDCEHDYDFVNRRRCEGAGTRYEIGEGGENTYRLELDDAGELRFGSASGYVGWLCGIEGEPYLGRITAGSTTDLECTDTCLICAFDVDPSETQCLSCAPGPNPNSVTLTLEEYCSAESCPTNLLEAEERFAKPCGAANPPREDSTCGVTILSRVVGSASESYHFDQDTGELLGILKQDDGGPWGPCFVEDYSIGDTSPGACSAVTTCEICSSPDAGGAGGAGGEAGAAGAPGGTSIVRTCPPG